MSSKLVTQISYTGGGTSPTSWATVPTLTYTFTPVSSSSIIVISTQCGLLATGSDEGAEFRIVVDGTPLDLLGHAFSDNTQGETGGMSMLYPVTGYSGEIIIKVEWQDKGTSTGATIDTALNNSLTIFEILDNAEIIVSEAVSGGTAATGIQAIIMEAEAVAVAGSGSILLFMASMPLEIVDSQDNVTAIQFGMDDTPEGPVTYAGSDGVDLGFSASNIYCKTGVSAGDYDFQLFWQRVAGGGGELLNTTSARFFVIEITGDATLHDSILSAGAWALTTSYVNDPNLDTDKTVVDADSVIVIGAAAGQTPTSGDHSLLMSLGIDDAEVGGGLRWYNDNTWSYGGGALLHAAQLTAASHSFQLRGKEEGSDGTINTTENRGFFMLELDPASEASPRRIFNL